MATEGEIIVEIPQGKLQGKKDKSVFGKEFFCFHRIPYAKPPLGELRFKAPQPPDGWTGIRDATTEGTECPCSDWQDRTKYLETSNEDSLFVNVYCNQNPNKVGGKKRPVMVWIHGGGFEFGSGNRSMTGPDFILLHDVVFVTFNYRLGALGFLSLETVECPGNFGLKDQQLALKWVKNNISYFGGDPENITIFGISAGGASVHFQTLSLANKGLFQRAIAQSGTTLSKWAVSRCARKNAFLLGKRLGCDTTDDKVLLDFLRKASAKDIVIQSQGISKETEGWTYGEDLIHLSFVPAIEPEHEGAFITEHPWILLRGGKQLDVPFITGLCSQEMIFAFKDEQSIPRLESLEDYQGFIPQDLKMEKNSETSLALARKIKEFYFSQGLTTENYLNALSDAFFNYPAYKAVKTRKNCKSPTYLYLLTYDGDQNGFRKMLGLTDVKGTSHGEDSLYLFVNIFTKMESFTPESRDYKFMWNFTKLWTNFATTGIPEVNELGIKWTKTTPEELEYLELGEKFEMKKGMMKNRFLFWDEIYTNKWDK